MSTHIDNIITGCACALYGLRTLRCVPVCCTVQGYYASLAWWGFTKRFHCTVVLQQKCDNATLIIFISTTTTTTTTNATDWIAFMPLSAEQLGTVTAQTLYQLSPRSVIKPIRQYLITSNQQYSPSPHLTSTQCRETLLYPSPWPLLSTSMKN